MSKLEKWSVWITSILTGVTGLGYLWTKYFVESSDPFAVVNHPLEPWFLKAHIIVSPFLLLALGMIVLGHVWKHFANRITWGRNSGILAAAVFLPMVVTGYLIQSVTGQGWLEVLAIAHIVTGCVFIAGLVAHQIAIHFLQPPPERRRLYPLDRGRRDVGRRKKEVAGRRDQARPRSGEGDRPDENAGRQGAASPRSRSPKRSSRVSAES